ncbi:MotA/TolQ/ExbB proton channel family protein [Achromobacter xylosoxidans]|uniref:MotA/TolQ/ExbB proton channel family protein n=4 Tax=Alcaligenes xylosoxydans xylosoxydans TaxID=85698 RepID=UPI0006C71745|nr:MotA/TolQ/ExbB proton channel family protein [Achromobacter xylosoxidans]AXA76570.1 MotA/TolQ/ExbB proton channel family protein [Achromobacter xylosoxidans]OFL34871.1 flagellar motor protein MotA [Achromobacter xylosoxidans]PNM87803.1 MotA/TolQ/ExbB proton channel family protein [Achromobacter xylosoxidans]CUI54271.1 colicin uptake protein TolQ [Achromobacter xylosoxidans]CUI66561.1 colicin uptake protein TolQ [Achromobacter xylosoxidans]
MSNAMHSATLVAQAATSPAAAPAAAAPAAAAAAPAAQQAATAAGGIVQQATGAVQQSAEALHSAAAALPAAAPAPAPAPVPDMGFLHFVAQSDFVGKTLFIILILMSLVTWYLILVKVGSNISMRRRSADFLNKFWNSSSLEQVEHEITTHGARDPFSHLASHAMHAQAHHNKFGATKLEEAGSNGDFVTRTMRKVIDEETAKLENGLTVLASVGSTAPFVGLFGTVWGVYHALVGIGLSDGVTINRIAGPVGEALIMTGLGLAVAIPAVLAYNTFVRNNRVYLSRLDAFAHDLFAFLTTGQQVALSDSKVRALRRQHGNGAAVQRGSE